MNDITKFSIKLYKKIFKKQILHKEKILMLNNFDPNSKSLIIFLIPSGDIIGGGIMSICSIYTESQKLSTLHHSEVLVSKYPYDENILFNKFTKFNNNIYCYNFENVFQIFQNLDNLVIHIPEIAVKEFYLTYNLKWSISNKLWLKNIQNKHLNILNQNIKLMPDIIYVNKMKELFTKLTQTTAHKKYSNIDIQNKFNLPLHHLSTFYNSSFYKKKPFNKKKSIIMVSPDYHPQKSTILNKLKVNLPDLQIVIVENMTYQEYKDLAADCMFSITFGEGLDGYFAEPLWSGGVSFAVFNEEFFTNNFKHMDTIYMNYKQMENSICFDIIKFKNEYEYNKYNQILVNILNQDYSLDKYKNNIKQFYLGNYSF